MPSPACTTEPATAEATRLWREIGHQVREACILRRQGRHRAAAAILEGDLPRLIRSWATESALPAAEAKARLNQLFNDEQARVESHWIIARFLAEERAPDAAVRHLNAFSPATGVPAAGLLFPAIAPRRIPIADVTDMIDAARDLERTAAQRPFFPESLY